MNVWFILPIANRWNRHWSPPSLRSIE